MEISPSGRLSTGTPRSEATHTANGSMDAASSAATSVLPGVVGAMAG